MCWSNSTLRYPSSVETFLRCEKFLCFSRAWNFPAQSRAQRRCSFWTARALGTRLGSPPLSWLTSWKLVNGAQNNSSRIELLHFKMRKCFWVLLGHFTDASFVSGISFEVKHQIARETSFLIRVLIGSLRSLRWLHDCSTTMDEENKARWMKTKDRLFEQNHDDDLA